MVRTKAIPQRSWKSGPVPVPGPTLSFTTDHMDVSEEEADAEFDDVIEEEEHHPLDGHPDIGYLSDLQKCIAECIMSGGDACALNVIHTHVAKKWKSLKRRDGSEYATLLDLKKAVNDALRPNPKVPNLFRKDEQGRSDRNVYRINTTIEDAIETMKQSVETNKRAKFYR